RRGASESAQMKAARVRRSERSLRRRRTWPREEKTRTTSHNLLRADVGHRPPERSITIHGTIAFHREGRRFRGQRDNLRRSNAPDLMLERPVQVVLAYARMRLQLIGLSMLAAIAMACGHSDDGEAERETSSNAETRCGNSRCEIPETVTTCPKDC